MSLGHAESLTEDTQWIPDSGLEFLASLTSETIQEYLTAYNEYIEEGERPAHIEASTEFPHNLELIIQEAKILNDIAPDSGYTRDGDTAGIPGVAQRALGAGLWMNQAYNCLDTNRPQAIISMNAALYEIARAMDMLHSYIEEQQLATV